MQQTLAFISQLSLSYIDIAFARFIAERSEATEVDVLLAAALSDGLGKKHSCLTFEELPTWLTERLNVVDKSLHLQGLLEKSALVGKPSDFLPMIADGQRLYLHKYWQYEHTIAVRLAQMAANNRNNELSSLKTLLKTLFPPLSGDQADWQLVAVAMALQSHLAIITGGPGTGKTTTVTKLMAAIIALAINQTESHPPIIKIAAPTGKAAARLAESIKQNKSQLPVSETVKLAIPNQVQTIHRLLGYGNGGQFKHHKSNPLHLDVLVIDEASMIDIALMYQIIEALPSNAQLILLGDKEQLTSVDTGCLLGDLCQAIKRTEQGVNLGWSDTALNAISAVTGESVVRFNQQTTEVAQNLSAAQQVIDSVCMLQHSYRFSKDSGIGLLADAINHSNWQGVSQAFADSNLNWFGYQNNGAEQFVDQVVSYFEQYLRIYQAGADYKAVLNQFSQFSLLATTKEGEWGVQQLNQRVERRLFRLGLIDPKQRFYIGRPIMVTENDYNLNIFNGDIGVLLPDKDNLLKAWFINENGALRAVLPARLPKHDTVFAMTVHKSQGSEFNAVACVLPKQKSLANKVTQELVYTAITRAKKEFLLLSSEQELKSAMNRKVHRSSGLFEQLHSIARFDRSSVLAT